MMGLPDYTQVHRTLETLYFASDIVLAGTALYGLKQISLLKSDIRIRNERAAKERALTAAEQFIKFSTSHNAWATELLRLRLNNYSGPVGDFTEGSIPAPFRAAAQSRFATQSPHWMEGLNHLESIATAFISGVADEELGFTMMGRGFCEAVVWYYDLICLHRKNGIGERNFWRHTIQLYSIWKNRQDSETLQQELKEKQQELGKIPKTKVRAIGT